MRRSCFDVKNEVFSDGTLSTERRKGKSKTQEDWRLGQVPPEWLAKVSNREPGKKIKWNPGAAEVWLMERQNGAPWREKAERLQQIEDEKAKREIAQKTISQLAKQVCQGLETVYNAHFESSDLIPLLTEAANEMQKPKPNQEKTALLKAVRRYDLKTVSNLLQAFDKSKPGTPSLSILSSHPVRPKP